MKRNGMVQTNWTLWAVYFFFLSMIPLFADEGAAPAGQEQTAVAATVPAGGGEQGTASIQAPSGGLAGPLSRSPVTRVSNPFVQGSSSEKSTAFSIPLPNENGGVPGRLEKRLQNLEKEWRKSLEELEKFEEENKLRRILQKIADKKALTEEEAKIFDRFEELLAKVDRLEKKKEEIKKAIQNLLEAMKPNPAKKSPPVKPQK